MRDNKLVLQFLSESNAIEGVFDADSLLQAYCAWEYLRTQKTLSIGAILKIHKILMLHQPLAPNEKGYFRQAPVWIGGKEAMMWPLVPQRMGELCVIMNEQRTEEEIKQDHIAYEYCHGFIDGNGRTGRMILNWQRIKNGFPILVIHQGEEQMDYYEWFR